MIKNIFRLFKIKKTNQLRSMDFDLLFLETLQIVRNQILGSIARIDVLSKRVDGGYLKMVIDSSQCYLEILDMSNKSLIFEAYRDLSLEHKEIFAKFNVVDKKKNFIDTVNSSDLISSLINFKHTDEMLDLMKLAAYKDFIHTKNIKTVQFYKEFILDLLDQMDHDYAYNYNSAKSKLLTEINRLETRLLDKGGLFNI